MSLNVGCESVDHVAATAGLLLVSSTRRRSFRRSNSRGSISRWLECPGYAQLTGMSAEIAESAFAGKRTA
jgi:hypothetical protein